MKFHILTLFPEMVMGGLNESITGRAIKQNKISVEAVNIRDFSENKHRKVDDYTYGGGAGMLMQAQPVYDAWMHVSGGKKMRTIYVTPQGHTFNQKMAQDFAGEEDLVILCGHYEGIDERVLEEVVTDCVSIGDYVLTGGELAAMVMTDAISRLVPGVLHNEVSAETESFHMDLLEYPQYSRPEVWHGKAVPQVLLSGNPKEVNAWRLEQSKQRTKERRPDLYEKYQQAAACKEILLGNKLLHMDMIELINRGQGRILLADEKEILVQSLVTGAYHHTLLDEAAAGDSILLTEPERYDRVYLHQQPMAEAMKEKTPSLSVEVFTQWVLTRREKLPVKGLYRPDGKPMASGLVLRGDDAGQMVAAYLGEAQAGYARLDAEGNLSEIYVEPQYRRQRIGKALETCLLNRSLEKGQIPYLRVAAYCEEGNRLQESLGLYRAKRDQYYMIYIISNNT